jgi:hypothetical protein
MKIKNNLHYIILIIVLFMLVTYIGFDYFSKSKNTTLIPSTISSINNSYNDLDGVNYDFDNIVEICKENLNAISSLKAKDSDYSELLNNYNSYFTSFMSLKDNKNPTSNYIIVLNSLLETLEDIKSYYSNDDTSSTIKNFQSFYKYNRTFLLKELDAAKKSLNAEITNSITTDYSNSMNKFYSTLSTICQNLTPALQRCYDNKSTVDNILNDVYIKQADIKTLKEEITKVSIPPEHYSSFEGLQELVKLCDIYLESMREVLVAESSSPSYDKELKDIYENPFSKYDDLTIRLSEYRESNSPIIK